MYCDGWGGGVQSVAVMKAPRAVRSVKFSAEPMDILAFAEHEQAVHLVDARDFGRRQTLHAAPSSCGVLGMAFADHVRRFPLFPFLPPLETRIGTCAFSGSPTGSYISHRMSWIHCTIEKRSRMYTSSSQCLFGLCRRCKTDARFWRGLSFMARGMVVPCRPRVFLLTLLASYTSNGVEAGSGRKGTRCDAVLDGQCGDTGRAMQGSRLFVGIDGRGVQEWSIDSAARRGFSVTMTA